MNLSKACFLSLFFLFLFSISDIFAYSSNGQQQIAAKEWNIMIYMAADNNLDSFASKDMQEIVKAGGSSPTMDVTVMYDGEKNGDSKYIHYNTKGKIDFTKVLGEIDSGDIKEVDKFVKWSSTAYPAKNYFLVLWNHGSGWNLENGIDPVRAIHIEGVAYDDNGTNVTTQELGEFVAKSAVKIDILGYDACLMQMIEVLYQVKDSVKYVVASEELEPGEGWPYEKFLIRNNFTPEELLSNLVDAYGTYGSTLSAINVDKFNKFLPFFKRWVTTLTKDKLASIKKDAVIFSSSGGIDLGNLIEAYISNTIDTANNGKELYDSYKSMFINVKNDSEYQKATGLAIYLPDSFDSDYLDLNFAKDFPAWVNLIR
ncbi:MAG: hypothetical protein HQK51_01935 [Oligoflexia bacterium]|nr:hypothetical protein [Oligoflexia bacterium]